MNRKNNPWISSFALLFLAAILTWICSGCENKEASGTLQVETEARFGVEHYTIIEAGTIGNIRFIDIITDNETGTQYMFYQKGSGSGLTKMEG